MTDEAADVVIGQFELADYTVEEFFIGSTVFLRIKPGSVRFREQRGVYVEYRVGFFVTIRIVDWRNVDFP